MKKKSQHLQLAHSEVKVKLLGTYLKRYFNIMSNTPVVDTVHYFDIFSGPGKYEEDGEGSPLIMLKELKLMKKMGVVGNITRKRIIYFRVFQSNQIS